MSVYALANEGCRVPRPEQMEGKGTVQSKSGKANDTKTLIRSLPLLKNHPLYAPLRELEAYKRKYGN